MRQFDDAIKHYRRALAIQPDHPDALNNLGNLYKQQGNLEEARKAYTMVCPCSAVSILLTVC